MELLQHILCKHQQGWKCKTEWCWKQSGTKMRLWTNILLRLRFPVFNIRIWGFYTLRSMVDLFLVLIWCQNDCKCWHISTFQMWSFCWGLWRRMWRRPRDLERKGYRIDKAVWHWRSHRLREENNLEIKRGWNNIGLWIIVPENPEFQKLCFKNQLYVEVEHRNKFRTKFE